VLCPKRIGHGGRNIYAAALAPLTGKKEGRKA
jgi:hypothetical protein